MVFRLPDLVGSTLSLNSLREELVINYATAEKWFSILERLYQVFKVLLDGKHALFGSLPAISNLVFSLRIIGEKFVFAF